MSDNKFFEKKTLSSKVKAFESIFYYIKSTIYRSCFFEKKCIFALIML